MALEVLSFKALDNNLATISAGFDQLNRGGLCELYILSIPTISILPTYNPFTDSRGKFEILGRAGITLLTGSEVFRIRFLPEQASFSENQKIDDSGTHYAQSLKIELGKSRGKVNWLKHKMRQRRYVAIYRDNNGLVKILGTKEKGMQFKFKEDSGKGSGDMNGYSMTGKLNSLTPAPFWAITGEITDNITIL